jgi:hypothetical protein
VLLLLPGVEVPAPAAHATCASRAGVVVVVAGGEVRGGGTMQLSVLGVNGSCRGDEAATKGISRRGGWMPGHGRWARPGFVHGRARVTRSCRGEAKHSSVCRVFPSSL